MLLKNFIISTTFFSLSAKRNASLNSRSLQFLSFSTKKGARKDKKQVAEQKSVTVFLNAKRLNEKKSASLPGTDGAAKSNKNLIKNMAPAGAGQKNESAAFASLPKPRATRLKPGSIVKGGRASDSFFEPGEALPFQASRSKPKNLWRPSARSQEFDNVKKIPSSEKIKFTSDTSRAPVVKKKRVLIRTGKWEPERITSTSPHYGRIHDGAAMVKKFQEEKERAARRARPGYDDFEYRMAYKYGVRERIRFNEKKPAKAKRLPALAAPTTAVAGVVAQNLSSGNVLLQNQQQSASPTLAVSAAKTPALAPTAAINNRAPALKAAPFKPGTAIIKSFNNKNDNRQRAEPYKPLTYFGGDTPLSVLEPLKPNPVAPRSSTQKNKNKYSSKKGKKRADWWIKNRDRILNKRKGRKAGGAAATLAPEGGLRRIAVSAVRTLGGDLRGFYAEPNTPTGDLSYGKMERRAPLNRLYSLSTKRLPRESTPALVVLYLKLMNFADSFLASDSAIPYVLARGEVKPRFISLQHVFLCKRNLVAVTKALDTLEMLITKIKEWKFTRKAHSNVLRLILVWWVKTMRHKYLQSKLKRAMFNLVGVMLNKKIVFREAGRKGRAAQIFGAPRGKLVRNIQTPSFLALPPRHTAGRLGPQKIRLKIKLGRSKRSDEMPRAATSKVRKLKKRETVYGYLVSRQKKSAAQIWRARAVVHF